MTDLLARRLGYAAAVTGGTGGASIVVTSSADSGPGTLREAVTGNAPKVVTFAAPMTIALSSVIEVGSNTTIDGTQAIPTITGQGLKLWSVSNIIVCNVAIRNAAVDGIQLAYSPDLIWIDHCTISTSGDGNIDMTRTNGATARITVSSCRLDGVHKCCLFGLAKSESVSETGIRATFFRNRFICDQRNPKVLQGVAHVCNNVMEFGSYGSGVYDGAHVWLDRNIYISKLGSADGDRWAGYTGSGTAAGIVVGSGNVRCTGNLLYGCTLTQNNPSLVSNITFPPLPAQTATAALRTSVVNNAGAVGSLVLA